MANQLPFTAYMRIVPERGSGKRFEIHRSRQRFARLVHENLEDNFTTGNVAEPGGGQTQSVAIDGLESTDNSSFSNQANAVAVVPQFGESPDTLIITGFYDGTAVTSDPKLRNTPYGEKKVIHSGGVFGQSTSGPAAGAPNWNDDTAPTTTQFDLVRQLKADLEAAVVDATIEVIKIQLQGVHYGHGGHHFPQ